MSGQPAVTVVSVTRNDLAGIQRTLASVREQQDVSIQHIVIDGASTDGTVEWLAGLDWPEGSGFTSEPDRGIYDAMNKGASKATGELIVFMNGGDRFHLPTTARPRGASSSPMMAAARAGWDVPAKT